MRISTLNFQNSGLTNLMNTQVSIDKLMTQISTGKKYQLPSDNPVAYDQIQMLHNNLLDLQSWQANIAVAENHLSLAESAVTSMTNILSRVNELQIQAKNGTVSASDKKIIAQEMSENLHELIELANTRDSTGSYIFSGFANFSKPYTPENDTYIYNGNMGVRTLQTSSSTQANISYSGHSLFENVKSGNGFFNAENNPANLGSGLISDGIVSNFSEYIPDTYTIYFATNSAGKTGYYVESAQAGQIVPTLPALIPDDAIEYHPDQAIMFNGMSVNMSGSPHVGDNFTITPSKPQNIFNSIQNIINALNMPVTNSNENALFLNRMNQNVSAVDSGYLQIMSTLTDIGAAMNALDNICNINEDVMAYNQKALSLIEDVDMVEAISHFTQKMTALETAQMSFVKIQGLSLFNYI